MLTSLALVFIIGLCTGSICRHLKLPGIIGMLFTGFILGPYGLNLLSPSILSISPDLRKIALIIILLKAGLSLDVSDLVKVGRPAILLCFLPASFEIIAYVVFAPFILGIGRLDAAIMGAVLAAVSPAVVVPRMVKLIEENYGTKKAIPQMIMAGASCDDVFVIVLFSTFMNMASGGQASILDFINIPLSILLGVILGALTAFVLHFLFEYAYTHKRYIRNSIKVIIILSVSFLLIAVENFLKDKLAVSGLIAVISMASVLRIKSSSSVSKRLSEKFGKLWLAAELVLFVLVAASVDMRYTIEAGLSAIAMIFIALSFRAVAVLISVSGAKFSRKEKLFCVIAYIPKATVQAAIASVPLMTGLACGKIVLSVAIMGILITAPLGAIGIDKTAKKLLDNDECHTVHCRY